MALALGNMEGSGTVDQPIRVKEGCCITREVGEGGKPSITHWEALSPSDDATLLRLWLETGRTHQIRVHMAYLGHPLLGDTKYGKNREDRQLGYRFQALCAYQVTFSFTGEEGPLSYLNGKTFTVPQVDFVKELFGEEAGKL